MLSRVAISNNCMHNNMLTQMHMQDLSLPLSLRWIWLLLESMRKKVRTFNAGLGCILSTLAKWSPWALVWKMDARAATTPTHTHVNFTCTKHVYFSVAYMPTISHSILFYPPGKTFRKNSESSDFIFRACVRRKLCSQKISVTTA